MEAKAPSANLARHSSPTEAVGGSAGSSTPARRSAGERYFLTETIKQSAEQRLHHPLEIGKTMKHAITLLLILTCASCATNQSAPDLQTAASVDLTRYQGTWYEIARLPNWFQKACTQSKATYKLLESGDVAVRNDCLTTTGKPKIAFGTASVVDKQTNAKLEVVFDNWFSRLFPFLTKGKYWILYLDTQYQTVIVGTPDRKYLWIMARTPQIEEQMYQQLVSRARTLGFDTDRLIRAIN